MWAGNRKHPQASFSASYMQHAELRFRVHYLKEATKMLKELKEFRPSILFRTMNAPIEEVEVWAFSDTQFNISSARDYGRTRIFSRLLHSGDKMNKNFHEIDWKISEQGKVSNFTYEAEHLACADGYVIG